MFHGDNFLSLQGPFAILAACPKLLDFDVKRTHFRKQLGRMDDRQRYRWVGGWSTVVVTNRELIIFFRLFEYFII